MKDAVRIRLEPLGTSFEVRRGTSLRDVLFAHGVEFPCGGRGRCKGCRVRLIHGSLPLTPEQERMLTPEETAAGWRLSCQCFAENDLTLEMAQWEASILSDESAFAFTPRHGLGVAVDVGTTTIVAQLLDLATGNVLAVRTALNPQARYGADIMSRVGFAVADNGQSTLVEAIRRHVGKSVGELLDAAGKPAALLAEILLVGNTVMHHLFCNLSVEPLSHYPFESPSLGAQIFRGSDLGWEFAADVRVEFLPCIGGFVGSDILAGVHAKHLHESSELTALIDLGTNGEIVLGNRDRLLCCSTAAGPAFEGARIHMGMRAATGAVSEISVRDGRMICHVLGNVAPRGICGSGLVDAVAAALDLGLVRPTGRLNNAGGSLSLCPPVKISQTDIRELQLAKGAIAAGVRMLLQDFGASPAEVSKVHLAGAFGNYVNIESAVRIGLMVFDPEQIQPAGNTALLGAKMAMFGDRSALARLADRIQHRSLSEKKDFQDIYVEEMMFPPGVES
jgi:uncharacterized 2Fe-2S/4Fe-4S cluster protein (DUF4445 family)